MIHPNFVFLAAVFNLLGTITYLVDTVKGKTKPNRVTWFLWALAPLIAFSAEIDEGVGIQSLMTFMVGFGPLLIFLASFINKKSVWDLNYFDYACGSLSIIGLILWLITNEGNLAIVFAIAADALAAVPTVVKSFNEPESETSWVFGAASISALITLGTIDKWDFAHYGFPLYILVLTFLLFSLIQFKLGKNLSRGEEDTAKVY